MTLNQIVRNLPFLAAAIGGMALALLALHLQEEHSTAESIAEAVWEALEQTDAAVVVVNHEGVISGWNVGAERLTGWTAVEVTGQRTEFLVPERFRDRHVRAMREALYNRQMRHRVNVVYCDMTTKDNRAIAVQISVRMNKAGDAVAIIQPRREVQERVMH